MDDLAKVGTHGKHPQNLFRDLKRAFGLPRGAPESFDWYELPMKSGRKVAHPFLLPHQLFASHFANRIETWRTLIAGPEHACREFWNGMRDSEFVLKHPQLPMEEWDHIIPLGFHADAGAYSEQDSVFCVSWNSLMGTGSTMEKRFLATILRKSEMSADTLEAALKILTWSFNIVLTGQTPFQDYLGNNIAGGGKWLAKPWKGALTQIRGDWQFYCEAFGFPQWNTNIRMCPYCKASNIYENLYWTKCGADAPWRDTRFTHETYLAFMIESGLYIPTMLRHAIGVRLESVMVDTLHCVDLGIAAHVLGNIFWYLAVVRAVWGGSNMKDNIKKLFDEMKRWYKKERISSTLRGELTVERVRKDASSYPKLKGKAAAIRHLIGFGLSIMLYHSDGSDHDKLAINLCKLLKRFYDIIAMEDFILSARAKTELPKIGRVFAETYMALSTMAYSEHHLLWKPTPKLHMWQEMTEYQTDSHGNPRFWWCYSDEDLVGQVISIAESLHPVTMGVNCLFKWLWAHFGDD